MARGTEAAYLIFTNASIRYCRVRVVGVGDAALKATGYQRSAARLPHDCRLPQLTAPTRKIQ